MQDSTTKESTFQLVLDQLEELVVTIAEEIRERPVVVLAVCAGLAGAIVGSMLASRTRRHAAVPAGVALRPRGIGEVAELAGLGLRLLQNPIVRAMIAAAIERQLKRRLSL